MIAKALTAELNGQYGKIDDSGLKGGCARIYIAKPVRKGLDDLPEKVAIKVLRISNADKEDMRQDLLKEGEILKQLDHPSFPKVHARGEITVDDKILPYYVTDYFDPSKGSKKTLDYIKAISTTSEKHTLIFEIMKQFLSALKHLHNKKTYHLDIKLPNTMLSVGQENTPRLILLDFGTAIQVDKTAFPVTIRSTKSNWPTGFSFRLDSSITDAAETTLTREKLTPQIDLHMMSKAITELLSEFSGTLNEEVSRKASYLKGLLKRLSQNSSTSGVSIDAATALEMYERWDNKRELTSSLAGGYVRIPGDSIRHFSGKVKTLVNTRAIQRLRRIKQLAMVSRIFPGAEHSRFEHALGTFENVVAYVEALCENGNSSIFLQDVSVELLNYTLLYALLHDVHHYPFYHAFEEILPATCSDEFLPNFIKGDKPLTKLIPSTQVEREELLTILKKDWGVDDASRLAAVFTFLSDRDATVRDCLPESTGTHGMIHVLRDIVNGPIDADKLDYLQRDGHHCGVPYANCFDRHRFLSSLSVDLSAGQTPKLSMTAKGSACAEALAAARYWMFNQVYWSHTVRSLTAMLRASITLHAETTGRKAEEILLKDVNAYTGTDETVFEAIGNLFTSPLTDCLQRQKPYKRLVVLTKQSEQDLPAYEAIIRARGNGRVPRKGWKKAQQRVLAGLSTLFDVDIEPGQILIDIPDCGKYGIKNLDIECESFPQETMSIGVLWKAASESFMDSARKIRVFVHPQLIESIKDKVSAAKEARAIIETELQ
ncbi:protein kinase [Desulfovibrio sp. JC022]|uniref:protein kinase domain-containing protein n=1 Tax=Desulfovibrio sp. JC022 TaxID=2593642 RepID=UPI0013D5F27E|nr:protein kinase [Desulfovibrio sp. JC022]NDV22066.1 protein kinase [Desulfovibrio sp. JC022]